MSEKKYIPATFYLAIEYKLGTRVKQDFAEAFHLMKICTEYDYPKAWAELANMYLTGKGTDIDLNEAYRHLLKGISHNDPYAYYLKGLMHKDKRLSIFNLEEATACFETAYGLGYKPAKEQLERLSQLK